MNCILAFLKSNPGHPKRKSQAAPTFEPLAPFALWSGGSAELLLRQFGEQGSGVDGRVAERLLDAQQLVVFRRAVRARK